MTYKEYSKIVGITAHGIMTFYDKGPWEYYHKCLLRDKKDDFHIEGKDLLGSAADCLLTQPDSFNDLFAVMDIAAIGGKTGKVILELSQHFEAPMTNIEQFPEEFLAELCEKAEIAGGTKWFLNKISSDKKYTEFYDQLVEYNQSEKTVITSELFQQAKVIQVQVLSDPFIGSYFRNDLLSHKVYYQVPVFFTYKGLQCKQLLDLVIIPNEERSFVISDLKTTSKGIHNYEETIYNQKLFIQGGFYSLPHIRQLEVKTDIKELQDLWNSKKAYLQDFTFVAADSSGFESPTEYSLGGFNSPQTNQILESGKFKNGQDFKGIDKILEEMKWHYENNLWEHTREYYEDKQAKLNLFK